MSTPESDNPFAPPSPEAMAVPPERQQPPVHPQWGPPPGAPGLFLPEAPRNGLGIAALCTGIIGALLALIPFVFWVGGILGLLALIFGIVGWSRARKGQATNGGVARFGLLVGVLTLALSVVGGVFTVQVVDYAQSVADADTSVGADSSEGADAEEAPMAFGTWKTYDDGVAIKIGRPVPYEPDEVAAGHTKGHLALQVQVTITNDSKRSLDISSALPTVRDAQGRQAEGIFDGHGATKPFAGKLLPGKRAVSRFAYSIPPTGAKELQFDVSPGEDYESGVWIGPAAK